MSYRCHSKFSPCKISSRGGSGLRIFPPPPPPPPGGAVLGQTLLPRLESPAQTLTFLCEIPTPYREAELFYSAGVTDCIKESVEDDLPLRHRRRIYLLRIHYHPNFDSPTHKELFIAATNCNGIIMASVWKKKE